MSIKKLTLASLILIGLTACGSSGSGSGSNHKSPEQKITEQKQELKDKADAAKVEAQRLKKQAEKAKEKAESLAKEAEKAKTEAERLAQEKAEKAKAEAERLAKEAEKAKAEAERLAKEKAEKEKSEEQKIIDAKGGVDNKPIGLSEIPVIKEDGGKKETYGSLYNQKYSVVKAQKVRTGENLSNMNSSVEVKGLKTTEEQLPKEGSAVYNGKIFSPEGIQGPSGGDLVYNVNFTNRIGSGKVDNMQGTHIELKQGNINNGTIVSTAERYNNGSLITNGEYQVEFFGPKAEEIGGKIEFKDDIGTTEKFGISGAKAN